MQTPNPAPFDASGSDTVSGPDGVTRTADEHKKAFSWKPADGLKPLATKAPLAAHALSDLVATRDAQDAAALEALKQKPARKD